MATRNGLTVEAVRETIADYIKYKNERDAAYLTFKHNPTVGNSALHTNAANAFKQFCLEKLGELYYLVNSDLSLNDVTDEEIIAALEDYKTCKTCERTLIYPVTEDDIIKTDDFIPGAKGWCYDCLVDHCKGHDCNTTSCQLAKDELVNPDTCPYRALKSLHLTGRL